MDAKSLATAEEADMLDVVFDENASFKGLAEVPQVQPVETFNYSILQGFINVFSARWAAHRSSNANPAAEIDQPRQISKGAVKACPKNI